MVSNNIFASIDIEIFDILQNKKQRKAINRGKKRNMYKKTKVNV